MTTNQTHPTPAGLTDAEREALIYVYCHPGCTSALAGNYLARMLLNKNGRLVLSSLFKKGFLSMKVVYPQTYEVSEVGRDLIELLREDGWL